MFVIWVPIILPKGVNLKVNQNTHTPTEHQRNYIIFSTVIDKNFATAPAATAISTELPECPNFTRIFPTSGVAATNEMQYFSSLFSRYERIHLHFITIFTTQTNTYTHPKKKYSEKTSWGKNLFAKFIAIFWFTEYFTFTLFTCFEMKHRTFLLFFFLDRIICSA